MVSLGWHPAEGDRFQLDLPDEVELEAEADVFTVSEMTIEARQTPSGTDLAFNGTTEWALDAVTLADAVWLPREDQLRELLRGPSAHWCASTTPSAWTSRSPGTASRSSIRIRPRRMAGLSWS